MQIERRFISSYEHWIDRQKSDLTDLLRASTAPSVTETQLRSIIERCMEHYQDYYKQRRTLAREDGPIFFSPPWCTSFENSLLWMGGCRPSLIIRLLYSLTGCEMEAQLEEFLKGRRDPANVGLMGLSAGQLQQVNELHQRTLHAEGRLSSRLATLQEDVADKPLLPIVMGRQRASTASTSAAAASSSSGAATSSCGGFDAGPNGDVQAALQSYAVELAKLMGEADALRLTTARTLAVEILSPRQAIELLVAAKQLHLCVHEWGVQRDHQRGRG